MSKSSNNVPILFFRYVEVLKKNDAWEIRDRLSDESTAVIR